MNQSSRRADHVHYDKFNHSDYDLVAVWLYEEDRIVVLPASDVDPGGNFLYIPTKN